MPQKKEKEKLRAFTVNAWVQVLVGVKVEAKSFDDAVEITKSLDVEDFVSVLGEYVDGRAPSIYWISDDEKAEPRDG